MKKLSIFDKLLMLGVFLIVVGLFTLAFVIKVKGGQCAINPCAYASAKNISCFVPKW